MAYQPKSYRKFLATSVTAAMVATVAAPVIPSVSADTPTSFPDVATNHWASDSIAYLVEKGAIEGRPDGTFDPNASITRAEAAKILAITLGLDVDSSASTNFSDAANHWGSAYIAAIQEQAPGVIDGYTDGTFRPNRTITRQEMAKMIVTAYDLEADPDVNIDFTDNNSWGAEYVDVLASLGIVEGVRAGQFQPQGNVTRAQTPVFVHRTEVPEVRVNPGEQPPLDFEITEVSALDRNGEYIEVQFNKPVSQLDRSDVRVQDKQSRQLRGIEELTLSRDGRTAQIKFYENAYVEELRTYEVTISVNNQSSTFEFERPAFVEEAIVTSVDHEDRTITVRGTHLTSAYNGSLNYNERVVTLDVPEDFDLEAAKGVEHRIWYNSDDELIQAEAVNENVLYGSFTVTEVDDNGDLVEIELVTEDETKKYEVSTQKYRFDNDEAKFLDLIDGESASGDWVEDAEYDYAKVVLGSNNRIQFIDAFEWDDFIVADEIDDTVVTSYDNYDEVDFDDYVLVRDGETISVDDIDQGDIIFYNEDAEYAEVYTNEITGEVTAIYDDSFEVDDVEYDYYNLDRNYTSLYLNEDGEIETFSTTSANDRREVIEQIQDAGDITIYVDRHGELVFVTGEYGEVQSNTYGSVLLADMIGYEQATRDRIELEVKKQDGEVALYDFRLDSLDEITYDGETYEIDQDADAADDEVYVELRENPDPTVDGYDAILIREEEGGTVIETIPLAEEGDLLEVVLNDSDVVKELIFPESTGFTNGGNSDNNLELSDRFVEGKRLRSNTVVFDVTDGFDEDDITVSTWGELEGFEIEEATVYFDEDDNVTYLVVTEDTASDVEEEDAVVTNVQYRSGDIVRISVFINGEFETFEVDEVGKTFNKGDIVTLEINESTGVVEDIHAAANVEAGLVATSIRGNEVTIAGGRTLVLDNDGYVVDAEDTDDIETGRVRDLDGKTFTAVYSSDNTNRYVKYFVITDGDAAPYVADFSVTAADYAEGDDLVLTFSDVEDQNGDDFTGVATVTVNVDGETFTVANHDFDASLSVTIDDPELDADNYNGTVTVGDNTENITFTVTP
ncbi:S-layer homology domain-containing protein [Halalkalibacter oceani]|uniref:S-layer homology domain-containing protein n=1 Tax=Halalkalibacter oceani TaxID=1653776 RepID=UPI003396EA1B